MGLGLNCKKVYVIDFGLSKSYIKDYQHMKYE
jgi:hypothetical protein